MNTGLWINVYFLLLILASDCTATILPCGHEENTPYFYKQLENALLDSPNSLYSLHKTFFLPNRVPSKVARIILHLKINYRGPFECTGVEQDVVQPPVEHTQNISENNASHLHEYSWNFKWSSSAVLSQINMDESITFQNILLPILYSKVTTSIYKSASITLYIASLPCKPTDEAVFSTVTAFLTWIKPYARDQGRPSSWRDEDRGYISLQYNYWVTEGISDSCKFDTVHIVRTSLLIAYISLSLLIPIFLVKFGKIYYFEISQKIRTVTPTSILIWAATIVIVTINTICFECSIFLYVKQRLQYVSIFNTEDTGFYNDWMAAFAARSIITPLVYIFELLIAARIPKDTGLPIPSVIQKTLFCCPCFSSSMQSKIIQTLAVWHIMIFIQNLTVNAIPITIFLLIEPLWSISVLGVFACFILFAVVLVAYLLYQCTTNQSQEHRCKRYTIICLKITGMILSLLITFHLIAVYFIVINASGGAIGFLASFLPPAILSLIGWYLKKKIKVQVPQEEGQMSEATPLLNV